MRIGIDARLWNETGVGRYIRNLVENLLEIDTANEYVLFVDQKTALELKSQNKIARKNVKIIETNIRWHTLEEQELFPKVLEKENVDLVHFPYFSVPIFYKGPYVITIHDLIIHHYPTGKASTLPSLVYWIKLLGYKYVIKKAAQHSQKVITVSEATKKEIEKHLHVPGEKITVTYEGVENGAKFKTQSSKFEFKDHKYFLYVGNAYPHKNLDRLVEAFGLVCEEDPEVKLILVGKDDYFYRRLKDTVSKLGISQNIIFAGFVTDEELQGYYQHAKAIIMPSLMEGFGLPGLEAMRLGCPVLASDIPSLKEIYQDAALYFDPLAVDSMHATIRKVLTERKSVDLYIEKGKKRVLFFSWKKMTEQTLKIYESCTRVRSD